MGKAGCGISNRYLAPQTAFAMHRPTTVLPSTSELHPAWVLFVSFAPSEAEESHFDSAGSLSTSFRPSNSHKLNSIETSNGNAESKLPLAITC